MPTWGWVLVGGGVLWYLTEREKAGIQIAGNKAAQGAISHAGAGVNKLIDEGASALGSFLNRLGSGGGSSPGSGSSSAFRADDVLQGGEVEGYVGYDPTVGITDAGT